MIYRQMGKSKDEVSILGYGCLRFPRKNGVTDEERTEKQIISAIEGGVNYFDTAYIYDNGKSEAILGNILSKGYRDKVKIATKMPHYLVRSRKDMDNIFETQLKRLKTDHIDYYILHAITSKEGWQRLKQLGITDFLDRMKKAGKIQYVGFSYHGDRYNFKDIIDDYPWDMCQIQYNYMDEHNQAGREGLEYAASKGLGVVIMEPLRGGSLAGKVPLSIENIWNKAGIKRSPAEWALRWIWNHPEVTVVLSGMNEEEQIAENVRIASSAYPQSLTPDELSLVREARDEYTRMMKVGCTGCGYCMPCPAGVNIPICFSYYNSKHLFENKHLQSQYMAFTGGLTGGEPSYASLCKECGKCEKMCPQGLPIRRHLKEVAGDMQAFYFKPVVNLVRGYYKVRGILKGRKKLDR